MHAPTIPADKSSFAPQKRNFVKTFDHHPFMGKTKVPKYHRNGRPVIVNCNPQYIEQEKLQGGPKVEFLLKNGLDENSSPQDWFTSFQPVYDGSTCNPNTVNSPCWMHRWALFTNMKAMLLGTGVPGGVYPNFKPFSYQEIECFIGLYVIQGLNPSPRIKMKFSSQQTDPLQDLIYVFKLLEKMLFVAASNSRHFLQSKIHKTNHQKESHVLSTKWTSL